MAVAMRDTTATTGDGTFQIVVSAVASRPGVEVRVSRSTVAWPVDVPAPSSEPIAVFELGGDLDLTGPVARVSAERSQHRAVARDLRGNAGVDVREHVEAVADFGAAARRLRESVRGGTDDAPARPRFQAAAARAAAVQAAAVEPVAAESVESIESIESAAKKRESVTLRYLRNRRAGKA